VIARLNEERLVKRAEDKTNEAKSDWVQNTGITLKELRLYQDAFLKTKNQE